MNIFIIFLQHLLVGYFRITTDYASWSYLSKNNKSVSKTVFNSIGFIGNFLTVKISKIKDNCYVVNVNQSD